MRLAYDKERTGEVVGPCVRVDATLEIPVPAQYTAAHQVTLPNNDSKQKLVPTFHLVLREKEKWACQYPISVWDPDSLIPDPDPAF